MDISLYFEKFNEHFEKISKVENNIKNNKSIKLLEKQLKEKSLNENQLQKEIISLKKEITSLKEKKLIKSKKGNFNKELNIANKDLLNEISEERKKNQNLSNQINKLDEELTLEKSKNQNLQFEINELTTNLNKQNANIQLLFEKLNSEVKIYNDISNNLNRLNFQIDMDMKEKEIKELNMKLSRYPFELSEEEKLINITFLSIDESIIFSTICKNTDNFGEIVEKLYKKHPEQKGDNSFSKNGFIIDIKKNLIENNINDDVIIQIIKDK